MKAWTAILIDQQCRSGLAKADSEGPDLQECAARPEKGQEISPSPELAHAVNKGLKKAEPIYPAVLPA